jgi:hypothetical protein
MTNLVNCEPVSVEEVRSVNHTRYPDLSEFSHSPQSVMYPID